MIATGNHLYFRFAARSTTLGERLCRKPSHWFVHTNKSRTHRSERLPPRGSWHANSVTDRVNLKNSLFLGSPFGRAGSRTGCLRGSCSLFRMIRSICAHTVEIPVDIPVGASQNLQPKRHHKLALSLFTLSVLAALGHLSQRERQEMLVRYTERCIGARPLSVRQIRVHRSHSQLVKGDFYRQTSCLRSAFLFLHHKKSPACWRDFSSVLALPIFPASHPASIVGANELNFCVRDGNRWTLIAINTNYFGWVLPIVFSMSKLSQALTALLLNASLVSLTNSKPSAAGLNWKRRVETLVRKLVYAFSNAVFQTRSW